MVGTGAFTTLSLPGLAIGVVLALAWFLSKRFGVKGDAPVSTRSTGLCIHVA